MCDTDFYAIIYNKILFKPGIMTEYGRMHPVLVFSEFTSYGIYIFLSLLSLFVLQEHLAKYVILMIGINF